MTTNKNSNIQKNMIQLQLRLRTFVPEKSKSFIYLSITCACHFPLLHKQL